MTMETRNRVCDCTATVRCAEAHALRDAYRHARDISSRLEITRRYTQHLYACGELRYPTTATPTWQCAEACEPAAPCRGKPTHVL